MLSLFSFLFVFSKGREKSILSTFLPGGGRRRRRRRRRKGFVTEGCWTTPELDRYRGRLSFLSPWNWRRKNTERMPSSPPPPPPPPRAATPSRKTGTTVFTPVLDVIRLRIRVSSVIVSYPFSPDEEVLSTIDLRDSRQFSSPFSSLLLLRYATKSFSTIRRSTHSYVSRCDSFLFSSRRNRDREESDFLPLPISPSPTPRSKRGWKRCRADVKNLAKKLPSFLPS